MSPEPSLPVYEGAAASPPFGPSAPGQPAEGSGASRSSAPTRPERPRQPEFNAWAVVVVLAVMLFATVLFLTGHPTATALGLLAGAAYLGIEVVDRLKAKRSGAWAVVVVLAVMLFATVLTVLGHPVGVVLGLLAGAAYLGIEVVNRLMGRGPGEAGSEE